MADLAGELLQRLREVGLAVDTGPTAAADAQSSHRVDLVLSRGGSVQEFELDVRAHATLSTIQPAARDDVPRSRPVLAGAAFVSPRSADAFRRAGIQYVDAAGNALIRFGDVLIDVRGRPPGPDGDGGRRERTAASANLFSAGRAQVTFVLLQWPTFWKAPRRDVAAAAGVSLGQAHNALAMLRDAGFGPGGHRRSSELLDLWAAAFASGLARKLLLATYRGSVESFRKLQPPDPVFNAGALVSGELAADDLLRPAAMTIYVPSLDPMLAIRNRWRSDAEPNITIRRIFWTGSPGENEDDDRSDTAPRTAPDVLVYADLLSSDDARVRSVASTWRDRIARRQLDP